MGHTKGKWNISSSVLIVSEDARVIANTLPLVGVPDLCIEFFEAEANARLIAAAPDLLAACEGLASIFPEESMSEMDAADFKDRASRIWTAALEAKIAITKATQ